MIDRTGNHRVIPLLFTLVQLYAKQLPEEYSDYFWNKLMQILNNAAIFFKRITERHFILYYFREMLHPDTVPAKHLLNIKAALKAAVMANVKYDKDYHYQLRKVLFKQYLLFLSPDEQEDLQQECIELMASPEENTQAVALILLAEFPKLTVERQKDVHRYLMQMLPTKNSNFFYTSIKSIKKVLISAEEHSQLFDFSFKLLSNPDKYLRQHASSLFQSNLTEKQLNTVMQFLYDEISNLLTKHDLSYSDSEVLSERLVTLRQLELPDDWCVKFIGLLTSHDIKYTPDLAKSFCWTLRTLAERSFVLIHMSLQQAVDVLSQFQGKDCCDRLPSELYVWDGLIPFLPMQTRIALLSFTHQFAPAFASYIAEKIQIYNELENSHRELTPELWRRVYSR